MSRNGNGANKNLSRVQQSWHLARHPCQTCLPQVHGTVSVGTFFVSCCLQTGQGFVITYVMARIPRRAKLSIVSLCTLSTMGSLEVGESAPECRLEHSGAGGRFFLAKQRAHRRHVFRELPAAAHPQWIGDVQMEMAPPIPVEYNPSKGGTALSVAQIFSDCLPKLLGARRPNEESSTKLRIAR
jgi:hypothetical protein